MQYRWKPIEQLLYYILLKFKFSLYQSLRRHKVRNVHDIKKYSVWHINLRKITMIY